MLEDLSRYGSAYSLNANLENILTVAVNDTIIFFDIEFRSVVREVDDMANIFVIDISHDDKFLISGMEEGECSVWTIDWLIIEPPIEPP